MSYRPKPLAAVDSTERASGCSVDGSATNLVTTLSASLPTGNTDVNDVGATITQLISSLGSAERANGDFVPCPGYDGLLGPTWRYISFLRNNSTPDCRFTVGTAYTGAGNTLSNGLAIFEFIP